MNTFFGDTVTKDIDCKLEFRTTIKKETEYTYRVEEDQQMRKGIYIVQVQKNGEMDDDESSKIKRMPSRLGAFILSNGERILKN